MKILLTGFDPFDGADINPAYEAVRRVSVPEEIELIRLEVPTVFGRSADLLRDAISTHRPDAVILVGQAGGRDAVTVERVAINLMDATIADNAGYMPTDEPVEAQGENALFATLPVKQLVQAISDAGIRAKVSYTAGTFVCNQLFYAVLRFCKMSCPETRAVFIHLPFLPEQTKDRPQYPSMELSDMVAALQAAVLCAAEGQTS